MSTCYFYAMHNGFEPTTGGSKFGEHREQQIWEKQSGGLFRSECAILGIPSSVPITDRYRCLGACGHLCKYCYANTDPAPVRANLRRHDPSSPFLLGGSLPGDTIHQATQTSWLDPQLRLEF